MNPARSQQKGEVLKLGPPAAGEVVITVDPGVTGAAFAAGTQTLLPHAEIPVHRLLEQDAVLFVHKGQGRATLNEQSFTVVPGAMLPVPRGAWHGLRNTGTGALEIVWLAAPPGLEAFLRDLSRLGVSPSAEAVQEVTRRHRIELRPATETPTPRPAGLPHRGRRGGRRRNGARRPARPETSGQAASAPSSDAPPSSAMTPTPPASAPSPSTSPATPRTSSAPRGHHRRRRGRGGPRPGSPPPTAAPKRSEQAGPAPSASSPPSAPAPAGAARQRPSRGRRSWRAKEVYMGGRWVRVEGEGPTIAPGSRHRRRPAGPKRGGDDDPPTPRLSVPL